MTTTGTSDLYDRHGETLQVCDLPLRNYGQVVHFAGPVVTFRSREDNILLKDIVAEPGRGRIIVVDTESVVRCAMLGDNMALRALENGWAGIVVNGAVRDVDVLATLPIGVKALGTSPRRSRKDGVGERDGVLTFGGARFTPGDHLVSDQDGLVVAPSDLGVLS